MIFIIYQPGILILEENGVTETNQNRRIALFLFMVASIYYIADNLLPFISYISKVYIQIFMIFVIIFISIIDINNRTIIKFIIPFLPLVSLQLINQIVYHTSNYYSIIHACYGAITFIIPTIICYYLLINNYHESIKKVLIISFILLFITSITSIYGLISDPIASKILAMGGIDEHILMTYYQKNIGGFSITYMIPIIVPMLIATYKTKKISFFKFIILALPITYFLYKTQYATALLMLIVALLSYFFADKYSFKKFILIVIAIVLFFVIARSLIGQILYYIADSNPSFEISQRFHALGDTMMGIESVTDAYVNRVNAYQLSITDFFSSPILGQLFSGGRTGGHSFIFDILALYGVFGIVALFLLYRQIYRYFYEPFKSQSYYGYMLWSFISSIVLACINTTPNMFVISLVAPLVAYILQDKEYSVNIKGGELA